EDRADDRTDAVGEKNLAEAVAVARSLGALDVVHAFGEVVDAEGNRRDEQRADVCETGEDITGRKRKPQPGLRYRAPDRGPLHDAAPAEQRRDPPDRRADDHPEQPAGP